MLEGDTWEEMDVRIDDLVDLPQIQVRIALREATAQDYKQVLEDSEGVWPFPRIKVIREIGTGRLLRADGWHRTEGARLAEWDEVPAYVKDGTIADALVIAVGNGKQGLPLSRREKIVAIQRCLAQSELYRLSNRELARMIGVSHGTVNSQRREFDEIHQEGGVDLRLDQSDTPLRTTPEIVRNQTSSRSDSLLDHRTAPVDLASADEPEVEDAPPVRYSAPSSSGGNRSRSAEPIPDMTGIEITIDWKTDGGEGRTNLEELDELPVRIRKALLYALKVI